MPLWVVRCLADGGHLRDGPKLPMPFLLTGLIAAPFTPMDIKGDLVLTRIPAYAAHLVDHGVAGAFVCGTTGEGSSLTHEEREQVAARWCTVRSPGLKVIVHVGTNSCAESQSLARHAQMSGADAIATLAPGLFRPAAISDLVDWCTPIAAAAPALPFFYYHMPAATGVDFPMREFLPRAAERMPTFAGIKFTHENLMDFAETLDAAGGRYAILAGRDEILLSFLVLGGTGAVGSTYNYAAPIYHRLIAAYGAGDCDQARRWQAAARGLVASMSRFGGLPANKAIMGMTTGIDCGPVRSPLPKLSASQVCELRADLEAGGFFANLAEAVRARAA